MTVEELRDRSARLRAELLFAIGRGDAALVATGSNIRIAADVDEVLNAFHAEGVAEGAEQERERIRKSAQKISTLDEGYHFVDCHFAGAPIYCVPELMLVLSAEEYPTIEEYTSVLAPTKEES